MSFLKTSGNEIVNPDGSPFLIKGIGLGGWLVTEGYMLGIRGEEWAAQFIPQQNSDPIQGSPFHIRQQLINLVGEQATDTFLQQFRNNFITEQDIQQIKDWGFNTIRLPLHYQDLSPNPEVGFALIDRVVQWAKQYGLYVILDMHAAPGSQNPADHSDSTKGGPQLWNNPENQNLLVDIWRKIANKYANETQIAGYDLLNEPVLESDSDKLRTLYERIAQAIRTQDPNHILFVQGNEWATDFSSLKPSFDPNVVYTFHHYGGTEPQEIIATRIQEIREQLGNVPVFFGEFGENNNTWFSDAIQAAEANNIGWAWWTYKKVDTITSPLSVDSPQQYDKIINYWKDSDSDPQTNPKPTPAEAQAGLDSLIANLQYNQNIIHPDVVASLRDPEFGTENKPFKQLVLPGKIDFINYDLGENNLAYYDKSPENKGGAYRNDGVDIYRELYVGDTEAGEWLKYSVNISQAGQYELSLTVASAEGGQIRLKANNSYITDINIPNTGGWLNWQEISYENVSLPQGETTLTVEIIDGGVNLRDMTVGTTNYDFNDILFIGPFGNLQSWNIFWDSDTQTFAVFNPNLNTPGLTAGGIGDLNGNGSPDIVYQAQDGTIFVRFDANQGNNAPWDILPEVTNPNATLKTPGVEPRAVYDADGDGRDEILFYQTADGGPFAKGTNFLYDPSSPTGMPTFDLLSSPAGGAIVTPDLQPFGAGLLTGDNIPDIIYNNPSNGETKIYNPVTGVLEAFKPSDPNLTIPGFAVRGAINLDPAKQDAIVLQAQAGVAGPLQPWAVTTFERSTEQFGQVLATTPDFAALVQ